MSRKQLKIDTELDIQQSKKSELDENILPMNINSLEEYKDFEIQENLIESTDSIQDNTRVLKVYNIMASANLGCALNLRSVARISGNSIYNPKHQYSLRIDIPKKQVGIISISIFSNGKIVATGGNDSTIIKRCMLSIAKGIKNKLSAKIRFKHFKISNILAVYNIGKTIRLRKFAKTVAGVDYEPERFAGACLRIPMEEFKRTLKTDDGDLVNCTKEIITAAVFSTGNITFTGGRSTLTIHKALEWILPFIENATV